MAVNDPPLDKLRPLSLQELCVQFDWSRPVNSFLTPRATFQTLLQSLVNHQCWFDAANLLAHALPQREAVWWAVRICEDYLDTVDAPPAQREEEEPVLRLSRDWVREPQEDKRIAVYTTASALPHRSPVHWVGMSVFWSTGNITPDAGVVTPPPPYLYARAVSASVDLAAGLSVVEREALYLRAIGRGLDIAAGGDGNSIVFPN